MTQGDGAAGVASAVEVACDICGSEQRLPLHDRGRGGQPLQTVVCGRCGFVFTSPRPEASEAASIYTDGGFSEAARGAKKPDRAKMLTSERAALVRLEHIEELLRLSGKPGHVLEVGCGIGSFIRGMRGFGWDATGIEPDPSYREYGIESYGVHIMSGLYDERTELPAPPDLICSFHVLEHAWSPREMVQAMRGDLASGGHLYLEVPTIERPFEGDLDRFFWAPHLSTFSSATLAGLLEDEGFDVLFHGFRGNALWMLARPTATGTARGRLRLPLDPPDEVIRRTRELERQWKRRQAEPDALRLARRVRKYPRMMASKAYEFGRDRLVAGADRAALTLGARYRKEVAHVGVHRGGNAGDTVLFEATRRIIDSQQAHAWRLLPLREVVDDALVRQMNRTRGVVIGGGGLFLRDTNENAQSGWQWACPLDQLERIQVPLAIFAVGYNRFRDQPDFEPQFRENVGAVIEKAAFVGLRNHGSMRAMRAYLPEHLADRIVYQPCATTMLGCYYPAWRARKRPHHRTIVVNAAFDRPGMRFQGDEVRILRDFAVAVRHAQDRGFRIVLALHATGDDNIVPWLRHAGVDFNPVQLTNASVSKVLAVYRDADLALGMRGHAQMVPFGLGTPILSVISHDKLGWFLDDVRHREWGVEVSDPSLASKLCERIDTVAADGRHARREVEEARERLWDLTRANVARIESAFSG